MVLGKQKKIIIIKVLLLVQLSCWTAVKCAKMTLVQANYVGHVTEKYVIINNRQSESMRCCSQDAFLWDFTYAFLICLHIFQVYPP
jgi:hypothetical protein